MNEANASDLRLLLALHVVASATDHETNTLRPEMIKDKGYKTLIATMAFLVYVVVVSYRLMETWKAT